MSGQALPLRSLSRCLSSPRGSRKGTRICTVDGKEKLRFISPVQILSEDEKEIRVLPMSRRRQPAGRHSRGNQMKTNQEYSPFQRNKYFPVFTERKITISLYLPET